MDNETGITEEPRVSPVINTEQPAAASVRRRQNPADGEDEEFQEKKSRVKKVVVILVILILVLLGLLYLSGLRRAPEAPPTRVAPISFSGPWLDVAEFKSDVDGRHTSRKFKVKSDQWRVVWSATPKGGEDDVTPSSLVFFVRYGNQLPVKAGEKPPYENVVVVGAATEPKSTTWNFRTKPGEYYFQIVSTNAIWKMKVQEMPVAPKPQAQATPTGR